MLQLATWKNSFSGKCVELVSYKQWTWQFGQGCDSGAPELEQNHDVSVSVDSIEVGLEWEM